LHEGHTGNTKWRVGGGGLVTQHDSASKPHTVFRLNLVRMARHKNLSGKFNSDRYGSLWSNWTEG